MYTESRLFVSWTRFTDQIPPRTISFLSLSLSLCFFLSCSFAIFLAKLPRSTCAYPKERKREYIARVFAFADLDSRKQMPRLTDNSLTVRDRYVTRNSHEKQREENQRRTRATFNLRLVSGWKHGVWSRCSRLWSDDLRKRSNWDKCDVAGGTSGVINLVNFK